MQSLKGKKLLILGGPALACDIVEKAREMGVYTIVTDWYEPDKSPAKLIADEYAMISISDVDSLEHFVKEKEIDGVFTQYTDSYLPYCSKLASRLGYPFCASENQLDIISNKDKSKNICIKHGIPVPQRYKLDSNFSQEDLDKISYPVLTKPVDSSGQRGIVICNDEEELKKGFLVSLNYSESKKVLVEKYLKGDYVVFCFTIQDGHLSLSAMADKPVVDEQYSNGLVRLPEGYILPSKYLDLYYEKLHEKFQALVNDLGLKNGSMGVEAIVNSNEFYIFEMQYRLGGMKHHDFVLQENAVDIMKMHIHYALTGQFAGWNLKKLDNPYYKNIYCLLNLLLNKGKIKTIEGIDKIKRIPEVYKYLQMHNIGDKIEISGTVMQIFAKVSIKSKSKKSLIQTIKSIQENLKILDEQGNSMLLLDYREMEKKIK